MRRTLSTAEICQRIRGNVIHAYLLFHSVARLQCAVAPWNLLTISVHENHPTGLHTIAKLQPKKERTPRKLLPLDFCDRIRPSLCTYFHHCQRPFKALNKKQLGTHRPKHYNQSITQWYLRPYVCQRGLDTQSGCCA